MGSAGSRERTAQGASRDVVLQRGLRSAHESSLKIKRKKGIRWMPWHQKATKDVALCDKFRGIECKF